MSRAVTWVRREDVLLAGAFMFAALLEVLWRDWGRPAWLLTGLAGVPALALLAFRRRHPLASLTVFVAGACAATLVQESLPDPTARTTGAFVPIVALVVFTYSLGAYGGRWAIALGAPQPLVLVVLVDLLEPVSGPLLQGALFFGVVIVVLPVVAGWLVRSRGRMLAELEASEARLAEEHGLRLAAARAADSWEVSRRLADTLEPGLESLLNQVSELDETSAAHDVEELSSSARALLARVRDDVVGLSASTSGGHPHEPPNGGGGGRPRSDASVWTILLAAAVGVGFLVETRGEWRDIALGVALMTVLVAALAMA